MACENCKKRRDFFKSVTLVAINRAARLFDKNQPKKPWPKKDKRPRTKMTRRDLKIGLRSGDIVDNNGEYLLTNGLVVDVVDNGKKK